MKLCLINPPHPYLKQPKAQAPLGLLYIAASVRKEGVEVEFVDLSDRHFTDLKNWDAPKSNVYGITGTILDVRSCEAVAKRIREHDKGAQIILGGPITISREHIDFKLFNSILLGEGEREIFRVLDDYPNLKQVYKAERILDLDALEFPARDLVSGPLGGSIFAGGAEYYGKESTVLATSRGCPFDCTFCASPKIWNRKIIYRSAESVSAEIDEIVDRFGVRQLRFSDDNLTADRSKLDLLCAKLTDRKIAWRTSIRVKPNGVDMFRSMKAAGCVEVCFGIESGDPEVLRTLHKKSSVDENRQAILNANEAGLAVRILFMIGTPGETPKTVQRNIDFLESLEGRYDTIAITNFTPLPGTAIAENPAWNDCEILDHDIDHYNLCLWGPEGQNTWENLVRPFGVTLDQLTANKKRMIDYVLKTGKSNTG